MKRIPILQVFRQYLFPTEFRISEGGYPEDVRDLLARGIEHFLQNWPPPTVPASPSTPPPLRTQQLSFFADIATGLWRMRWNMVPVGTERLLDARPIEEMRKPFRWLVSVWDALKENGLEIQDHTGDPFYSGQSLTAAAFEPTAGLTKEVVIQTIKPSIYLEGKPIQLGEVIVGIPETHTRGPSTSDISKTRQSKSQLAK